MSQSDSQGARAPILHTTPSWSRSGVQLTLPAEREQTDVRKMLQKMILGLQRDRYALSEPTELVLGMSYKSKIIFAKFSSDRLFLDPINSLA